MVGSSITPSQYCFDFVNKMDNGFSFPMPIDELPCLSLIRKQYTVNVTPTEFCHLVDSCEAQQLMETNDTYSEPMVWIGLYIAIASLFCILAMAVDLLHGFRNRKLWFPCKYFSLNAASITVITITMKLPVDLSSPMPTVFDQEAKLGSMAFMCTMIANLMPSLASMDNETLLANLIGLVILVITIVINIYIEIVTGVIEFKTMAYIYMILMLILLIILISSAIAIPTTKQILEFKYQATNLKTSNDQPIAMSVVNKLRQHVRRYWVMAESGSPQFVMASNPLSNACGIICLLSLLLLPSLFVPYDVSYTSNRDLRAMFSTNTSDYKWSAQCILIVQFIGVLVGSIAPIFRCFTTLSFKSYTKWMSNHFMVFQVEKYWHQALIGWKEIRLPFLSSGRRSRAVLHHLKNLVVSLCIGIQVIVVASCKIIGLIGIVILQIFVVCFSSCWMPLKKMFTTPIDSSSDDMEEDLCNYVLQIQDEMEFVENTLKGISNSMNRMMKKFEKEQHIDLLELLEKSTGFEGVEKFDTDSVQSLLSVEIVNNWSLPLISLTCIAIALPEVPKDKVERLLKGVGDGLSFTHLVEESLNNSSEYVNVRRASMNLWYEVEETYKWLENTLKGNAYKGKTSAKILKWFANKAKETVIKINKSTNNEVVDKLPNKLIVANSMYRIAKTILHEYQSSINQLTEEQLFESLSCMIADILSACLTNIPRVITTKCHERVIEKREASVQAAAKLLGRSMKIIAKLEARELPSMDPDKMIFIDEWRLHLKRSIP